MAVVVANLFQPTVLGLSTSVLVTMNAIPANLALSRCRIRFANTGATIVAVTAFAVPSGGTPVAGNCFLNAETVAPNAHVDTDVPVLAAGGSIQAFSDTATAITVSQLDGILFS